MSFALSCVVAVCLPLSFTYRLARRLVSRLVFRCPASRMPWRLVVLARLA